MTAEGEGVSCLYESGDDDGGDGGIYIGIFDGTIEYYIINEKRILSSSADGTELIHFWPHSSEFLQVIGSDGSIRRVNKDRDNTTDSTGIQIGTPISCVSHHPRLPFLIAYGSLPDHSIRLCELSSTNSELVPLQNIKYHDGFLGQRLGHINKVEWHPSRMVLGTITNDTFVSIYGQIKRIE